MEITSGSYVYDVHYPDKENLHNYNLNATHHMFNNGTNFLFFTKL